MKEWCISGDRFFMTRSFDGSSKLGSRMHGRFVVGLVREHNPMALGCPYEKRCISDVQFRDRVIFDGWLEKGTKVVGNQKKVRFSGSGRALSDST